MRKICLLLALLLSAAAFAQEPDVYPTHWWTGMKYNRIQLMLHGPGIGNYSRATLSYPGVVLGKVQQVQNRNYLFIDLAIQPSARPGRLALDLAGPAGRRSVSYELKARSAGNGKSRIRGITPADLIYLIMPDRFSNGDAANDRVAGLRDQSLNRDSIYHRHGGDLQGVQDHLDYLQELGITAVWLNPVILNDMPNRTEHGYAFTDHYRIDPRIGGEKAYHALIDALHRRGMKIIQDAVYNHTGIEHFLYRDMPDSTWFTRWPVYTQSSYKEQPLFDPYAAETDKDLMRKGWFGSYPHMPDIDHSNPFFANYLIQHAIWSTEEFGLDGWRIDTYPYNNLAFMNRCNEALLKEYPQLHIFGETWVHGVINQAYFAQNRLNLPFKSNLPGVTDFQTHLYGILPALKENFGWTEGVNKLYTTLAQDIIYVDPTRNVNFLDNHDKTRFFTEIGEDFDKFKMGIGWLLTTRGIPQLYYGTEILMKGASNPDGWVRLDFPGGWPGDRENKFTPGGRNAKENEAHDLVKTIANYRKGSSALTAGKLMQYVPEDGVYTYFRYDTKSTVMVVMNTAPDAKRLRPQRFIERVAGFRTGRDILSGTTKDLSGSWQVPGRTIWILELAK